MTDEKLLTHAAALAKLLKIFPNLGFQAKQHEVFPEIEKKAVTFIADAESIAHSLSNYESLESLVPEWKFVFASERGTRPGASVNRDFSDGSVVRSLFSKERVFVIDTDTHRETSESGSSTFQIDYSIALDTQALSYLAPYLEGKTAGISDDFREIFTFIAQGNIYVDPTPYMYENLLNVLDVEKTKEIFRRVKAYEVLRTIDEAHFASTSEVRSTISAEERECRVDNFISRMRRIATDPQKFKASQQTHLTMYCLLLKMAEIQLRNPRAEASDAKLAEFIEFMDTRMQTFFARETVVAAQYFARGQNDFGFFGKIQKNHPKNLENLKNMAWDFAHIRHLEEVAVNEEFLQMVPELKARYFFPALLTCDKDFIEVIDLYPLKSYAYKKGKAKKMVQLFPEFDWIDKVVGKDELREKFLQKYFSQSAVKRRDKLRPAVQRDLQTLRGKLEKEFRIAAYTTKLTGAKHTNMASTGCQGKVE